MMSPSLLPNCETGRKNALHAHAPQSLLPTLDDATLAERDGEDAVPVERRIELLSVGIEISLCVMLIRCRNGVMHSQLVAIHSHIGAGLRHLLQLSVPYGSAYKGLHNNVVIVGKVLLRVFHGTHLVNRLVDRETRDSEEQEQNPLTHSRKWNERDVTKRERNLLRKQTHGKSSKENGFDAKCVPLTFSYPLPTLQTHTIATPFRL